MNLECWALTVESLFEHDEWEHSSINGRYLEAFRTNVSTLLHESALSSERFSINLEMAR